MPAGEDSTSLQRVLVGREPQLHDDFGSRDLKPLRQLELALGKEVDGRGARKVPPVVERLENVLSEAALSHMGIGIETATGTHHVGNMRPSAWPRSARGV